MMEQYRALMTDTLGRSFPAWMFGALLAVLILAAVFIPKNKQLRFLGIYTVSALFLFFLPPAALFFKSLMYAGFTYWRFLWIIPYAAVGAGVLVTVLFLFKDKRVRILIGGILILAVMYLGNNVYLGADKAYTTAYNPEKLPQEAVDCVNIINAHAKEHGVTEKKAAVTHEFAPYIRQIDATIGLPFCRIMKQPQPTRTPEQRIYHILARHIGNEKFGEELEATHCNYVMCRKNQTFEDVLVPAGFEEIGGTGEFLIFAKKTD